MNVDPIARWYCFIEHLVFGGALERHRFALLDRLVRARRILILGEGDGRVIAKLLVAAPHAHIDVFELSGKMIELARQRLGKDLMRVSFHQQDALAASWPNGHYDGVVTQFFLDCFTEARLRGLVQNITAAMAPDAHWLVTDFAIPERGWRQYHARILIRIMYEFFAFATRLDVRTLPRIEQILTSAGLDPGGAFSGAWRLDSVRGLGASGARPSTLKSHGGSGVSPGSSYGNKGMGADGRCG